MIMFGSSFTIKRKKAEGHYDNSGKYVEGGSMTDITITADCQPLTGEELASSNVGRDGLGKIKVWTDSELIVTEIGTDGTYLQNGDRIVFNGDEWEIIQKFSYQNNLISHNEFIAEIRT